MKDDTFLNIIKKVDPEYNEEGITTTGFIDSGSYIFNAALSGSLYGGFPNNRVTALAGEQATGKSFFAMSAVKQFLTTHPDGKVVYFDTEFALDKTFFTKRGIDAGNVHIIQPQTLEDFRTKSVKILNAYEEMKVRPELLLVLDSLSNLPSEKEITDAEEGKNVRDMTKQQIIKSIFRVITQKLGKLNVPMLVTSHTYAVIGAYIPTKEMSGGSGLKYAASSIVFLSKKKDKDGTDVVGNFIKIKMDKSRFSRESQTVETKLSFATGIDRYHGLLELALKYNIFTQVSTRIELPDGSKVWAKNINEDPEKFYTPEIMAKLEEAARKEFALGEGEAPSQDDLASEEGTLAE